MFPIDTPVHHTLVNAPIQFSVHFPVCERSPKTATASSSRESWLDNSHSQGRSSCEMDSSQVQDTPTSSSYSSQHTTTDIHHHNPATTTTTIHHHNPAIAATTTTTTTQTTTDMDPQPESAVSRICFCGHYTEVGVLYNSQI